MSGRFGSLAQSLSDAWDGKDDGYPASKTRGLMSSLAYSCVLHLLVLFSPVFGTIARFAQPDSQAGQNMPSRLSVTLTSFDRVRAESWHPPVDAPGSSESREQEPKPVAKTLLRPSDNRMDGTDLLPLPGVIYYPTNFLTARPQPLGEVDLDPPRIRPIIASGKVILMLWVNPFGATSKIAVESTDLPQNFVSVAVAAFEQLRFKPGELHGQKVGAVMRIEVTYDDGRLTKTEVMQ